MQQSTTSETNLTLNDVKNHFDQWRATRPKRCKIPDTLWREVKTLAGRYSLKQITQELGINTYQISHGLNQKANITFVEVQQKPIIPAIDPPSPFYVKTETHNTCSIEIHRTRGGSLKISELPVASLPILINQFME